MRVDLNGVEDLHGNALFDSVVDHIPRTNSFTVKVDYVEPEIAPLRLDSPAGFGDRWLYADLTGPGVWAAVICPQWSTSRRAIPKDASISRLSSSWSTGLGAAPLRVPHAFPSP